MTLMKQAAIYYSASTVYELFPLELTVAFCFQAQIHMPDAVTAPCPDGDHRT